MIEHRSDFIWDPQKEQPNIEKHGVDFTTAARAFLDPERRIYIDSRHSTKEERMFCMGKVAGKVLTVRFIYREGKIRIIGAGYWRKGKVYYEKKEE